MNAVESLQRGHTPESHTPETEAASRAVFLHTAWRSGGTWLWSQCRDQAGARGLYEPLHEGIADLRAADITQLRPGAWRSSHGHTAPYFEEYRALLRPRGRGVAGYERRFAFEQFFLEPEDEDPALEAYLRGLLAGQAGFGRVAALKFCRSLGRVGWMERRFPEALHAVVLRRPLAQWQSGQRLLEQQRNRYFTAAPVLVLARNAAHPCVAELCDALEVRLPVLHSRDQAYGMERVWRHVRRQAPAERYRAFLAFWTATALGALHSRALVIETARLAECQQHRAAMEAALGAAIGARVELSPRPEPVIVPAGGDAADMAAAQAAAAACAAGLGRRLEPARLGILLAHLAEPGSATPGSLSARHRKPPVARRPAWMLRRVHTAAMVGLARALQPIRRLHGDLVRRRG